MLIQWFKGSRLLIATLLAIALAASMVDRDKLGYVYSREELQEADSILHADSRQYVDKEFAFYKAMEKCLLARRFGTIEAVAARLRSQRGWLVGREYGISLVTLYSVLSGNFAVDFNNYSERVAVLREWLNIIPQSVTARIAVSEALTCWADEVGLKASIVHERLSLAIHTLGECTDLPTQDPLVYGRLNGSCVAACIRQDRVLARYLFEKIGNRIDSDIWNLHVYLGSPEACRSWAYGGEFPRR